MKKNYNLSGNLQAAIERAIYVSEDFKSEELCTFHLILAILMNEYTCLQRQYLEFGSEINVSGILYEVLSSQALYEKITGNKYPANEKEEEKEVTEVKPEVSATETNKSSNSSQVIYIVNNSDIHDMVVYENIEYSSNLEKAFEDAFKRCSQNGQQYIDEDNLLFSIFSIENTSTSRLFENYEIDLLELKNILLSNATIYYLKNDNKLKVPESLKSCCEILNDKYTQGELCEILGRDAEISNLWNIFSKKTKRNAILVGDAGVGKTAIVEAITMQIVNKDCPKEFELYNVVSLNLNSMVAGTKYRGEFEQKVQHLINFLKSTKNVIVFIDEIHQILGAGSAEGSGTDLSGSLKPILARDDVVFVGSTTTLEYEKYFTSDPAFKRRFERIEVKEPKLKDVKNMVKLKVSNISKYHKISISDDVLDYIIITAKAMNYFANNPDVTIDLVDRAMAIAKINRKKVLKRNDVDKVYNENYTMFKKISKKDKLSTAYHEAGHALFKLLSKDYTREDLKIVSIIPTEEYLGVTISEENTSFSPITRAAVLERAAGLLAGRTAQEFIDKNWDFGASSDLSEATQIVRKMIVEMGMDDSIYTNISLYDYNSNSHTMSPNAIDKVNDRIKEVMQEVYKRTKEILIKNKDKLDIIANLLMKKGIVSVEEINDALKISKM